MEQTADMMAVADKREEQKEADKMEPGSREKDIDKVEEGES